MIRYVSKLLRVGAGVRRGSETNRQTGTALKAVRLKLDRLDEAFLYSESIDLGTYGRQRDKLREELTLSKIDYHAETVEELDVEGILAFAERILPRASDLCVQASLDYRQRLQQLFFPKGTVYDGKRFNRTAVTATLFNYLEPDERAESSLASRVGRELGPDLVRPFDRIAIAFPVERLARTPIGAGLNLAVSLEGPLASEQR